MKFKEVQQAYQQIMDERSRGYFSGAGSSAGYGGWYQNQQRTDAGDENSQYLRAAANYIQSGHYTEALNVLNSTKSVERCGISTVHRRTPVRAIT